MPSMFGHQYLMYENTEYPTVDTLDILEYLRDIPKYVVDTVRSYSKLSISDSRNFGARAAERFSCGSMDQRRSIHSPKTFEDRNFSYYLPLGKQL